MVKSMLTFSPGHVKGLNIKGVSLIEKSSDGELYLYKWKVMFGFRLRVGFIDLVEQVNELDICCGDDPGYYTLMRNKIADIIAYNVYSDKDPFHRLPGASKIKPYYKDEEFCNLIDSLHKEAIRFKKTM